MSSHWAWADKVIKEHQEKPPFAPENGEKLKFKVGDSIIYTNDYGIEFKAKITDLFKPEPINCLYATGYRYVLDYDCPWMPVKEGSLKLS